MNMEEASFLSRVPLFASLKEAQLAKLTEKLRTRSYRAGEVIFHQDDPGTLLYIIKSGRVKITTASPEGEEIIMAILNEGDSFGEIALLDGQPRSANTVAIEATRRLDPCQTPVRKCPIGCFHVEAEVVNARPALPGGVGVAGEAEFDCLSLERL